MIAETGRGWADSSERNSPTRSSSALPTAIYCARPTLASQSRLGNRMATWQPIALVGKAATSRPLGGQRRRSEGSSYGSNYDPGTSLVQANFELRRDLPNSAVSLENNIRLFGKFKGTLVSVFSRG